MNEKTDSELKGETFLQCHLTLPNDINTIPQLSEFIDMNCEELGVDMVDTMNINLALEEAVVNVMSYAYPEGTEGQVDIDLIADGNDMVFTITDSGTPFDPTQKEEVDTTLSAEERPIGGLGIHLVRKLMDSINYQYIDNKNVLTLKNNIMIEIKENNGGMLAILNGRLDTPAAVKAQQEIGPLLENADKEIVFDCTNLEYISSSGLRLFLTIRKEASVKGGKVIIENINDEIRKVFMMTGFFNLFEIRNA